MQQKYLANFADGVYSKGFACFYKPLYFVEKFKIFYVVRKSHNMILSLNFNVHILFRGLILCKFWGQVMTMLVQRDAYLLLKDNIFVCNLLVVQDG